MFVSVCYFELKLFCFALIRIKIRIGKFINVPDQLVSLLSPRYLGYDRIRY